jgi:protein O-mannosyl-transferase
MNRPKRTASFAPAAHVAAAGGAGLRGATFALMLILVLVAYFPSLRGDFLWDDAGHVTNSELQSGSGLWRIWFEPGVTQQYYPLLHSAFWLEHQIWGDAPLGYRLINLLWHATAACLFVTLLRRLAVPGALLAGLLFALHPVCVESVAWIAEQKNTLSTVLYLTAALAWLRFEDDRTPRRYTIATCWFLAALLTKTVTATLPAALLVLAWWRRGRLSWRGDALPLLPWLVLGASAGLFTVWFERFGIGAQGDDFNLSILERGLLAGRIFWFYLGKLVWPAGLVFFYPRWEIDATAAWQYLYPAAGLALLVGLIAWTRRVGGRGPLAAFLLFGGTLFPALGFLNVYPFVFSYVADHFQYLASLSLFALGAVGLVTIARHRRLGLPWHGAQAVAVVIMAVLGGLTWQQSRDYVDSITLYRATLARNPHSWVAHHNLAIELAEHGRPAEALAHARRAVELKANFAEGFNNLADILVRTGRPTEALPWLDRALELRPHYAEAHNTRGIALMGLMRPEEAIRHFERALELQRSLVGAHYNLGLAEAGRGRFAVAIQHFEQTLRLRPEHVGAELNWGVALVLSDRVAEARPHFERALQLEPEAAELRQTYGRALLSVGDLEGALAQMRVARQIDPALPGVDRDLAFILHRLGRADEAEHHALEARRER